MATVTKPMALDETLQATNEILEDIKDSLANSSIVGDTDISEIADGTLTGAVAEFDGEISAINTTLEGLGDAATKDVANTYDAESTDPISGQGVAEALETTEVESLPDTTPYLYRKSPAIGTRVMENALVGASVVVNQLVDSNTASVTIASGHKYIAKVNSVWSVGTSDGTAISVDGSRGDKFVDLTEYFGSSTIPDAAYTKETAQAGSGIAWLRDNGFDFSKYIPYNTEELSSVNPSAKKVVGKNLFDKDNANTIDAYILGTTITAMAGTKLIYIPCRPNTTYAYSKALGNRSNAGYTKELPAAGVTVYGGIAGAEGIITTDSDAKYLVAFIYNGAVDTLTYEQIVSTVQVEIGSQSTAYTPYEEHTCPISPSPLRGLFELVGDEIKASGDVRKSDGSTERKYAEVDLGSLTYSLYSDTASRQAWYATLSDMKKAENSNVVLNLITPNFLSVSESVSWTGGMISYYGTNNNAILLCFDSGKYSDGNAVKAAVTGQQLVYEIATPTTEQLAPFDNPQKSFVGGTEEFVTDNDVPVGHESEYKKLPVLFDDDYIQTIQERAENVIWEIADITPISGTATVTLLHEEDQGEDWIVGFEGEINGKFDTDHFDYYLTARYSHAYNTGIQILNMNNCTDGDYVNIWQTGTVFDFGVDGGVTVDISVTATKLTFAVNCIGDSIFGNYSSSEPTGEVKYLITPARKG